jgi:hypothetical protein
LKVIIATFTGDPLAALWLVLAALDVGALVAVLAPVVAVLAAVLVLVLLPPHALSAIAHIVMAIATAPALRRQLAPLDWSTPVIGSLLLLVWVPRTPAGSQ